MKSINPVVRFNENFKNTKMNFPKFYTFPFSEDFLEKIANFLKEYFHFKKDLSKVAVVFGGKRPHLFLNKKIASKLKKPFLSFQYFSIDRFMEYIVKKKDPRFKIISELEAVFMIYNLMKDKFSYFVKDKNFAQFFAWGREILKFLEEIDLEEKSEVCLKKIEKNAQIGYEVSSEINYLLSYLVSLRNNFHQKMQKEKKITRGFSYLLASQFIDALSFPEWELVLFCGFFYLYDTEIKVIEHFLKKNKALLFFQKDEEKYFSFDKIEKRLGIKIDASGSNSFSLNLYAVPDEHTQVVLVRKILENNIENINSTVIVLPQPEILIPLLSQISEVAGEFNVSLGYPIKRSPVFSMLKEIFDAQISRKDNFYYVYDYLKVLMHPFVKNVKFSNQPFVVSRVLVHKIEEYLLGMEESRISKKIFLSLSELENEEAVFSSAKDTLETIDIFVKKDELKKILKTLHKILFINFEKVSSAKEFCSSLKNLFDFLINKSLLTLYPFNRQMSEAILELIEEFELILSEENLSLLDIFKLFLELVEGRVFSFKGSPLKGLQVLGIFEVRDLNFENVIFLDLNEAVFPNIRVENPLIPREVLLELGIDKLEKEEEILRYHFRRLIGGAKNVFLIYQEKEDKERSRFVEEIIWEREKKEGRIGFLPQRAMFKVEIFSKKEKIKKKDRILEFLKDFNYSPTSLDVYLRCPLRFYYQYVLRLSQKDRLLEETESYEVGQFVHALLENFFKNFLGRKPQINQETRKVFFKMFEEFFKERFEKIMKEDAFILKEILKYRLTNFLEEEKKRNVEKILFLEKGFTKMIDIDGVNLKIEGKIDRIDFVKKEDEEEILIVDYKTTKALLFPKLKDLNIPLTRKEIKKKIVSFQLPVYLYLTEDYFAQFNINAGLYYLTDLKLETVFKEESKEERRNIIKNYFLPSLSNLLREILNPDIDFEPDDEDESYCKNCPFSSLCKI